MSNDAKCEWLQDGDGFWETACGEAFDFVDGTPTGNGMRYCCYCGRPLDEKPYVRDATDD